MVLSLFQLELQVPIGNNLEPGLYVSGTMCQLGLV